MDLKTSCFILLQIFSFNTFHINDTINKILSLPPTWLKSFVAKKFNLAVDIYSIFMRALGWKGIGLFFGSVVVVWILVQFRWCKVFSFFLRKKMIALNHYCAYNMIYEKCVVAHESFWKFLHYLSWQQIETDSKTIWKSYWKCAENVSVKNRDYLNFWFWESLVFHS